MQICSDFEELSLKSAMFRSVVLGNIITPLRDQHTPYIHASLWWFQIFVYVYPNLGKIPILITAICFRWVETTNQALFIILSPFFWS